MGCLEPLLDKFDYKVFDCPSESGYYGNLREPMATMNGKDELRERFICEATKIHGNRYDYSRIVYVNNKTNVVIGCGDHTFSIRPDAHTFYGRGCTVCKTPNKDKLRKRFDKFIELARSVHGDRYDYGSSAYSDNKTPISIMCGDHSFTMRPDNHVYAKRGCPICNGTENYTSQMQTCQFASRANIIHNSVYDYTNSLYTTAKTKTAISCPEHGVFYQSPDAHIFQKQGCPQCGGSIQKDTSTFIGEATQIHSGKYSYHAANYINAHSKVLITCHSHGEFSQLPANHLAGNGCPECSTIISRSSYEFEMVAFLVENNIEHIVSDRNLIYPKELDIYIPTHAIAIEINGLYFHSDQFKERSYHYDKWKACLDKNVQLLHINEDEWLHRKDIIKSRILHLCGMGVKSVGGRNLAIRHIDGGMAAKFCETFHLQGKSHGVISAFGAFNGDVLVGAMTFGRQRGTNQIELTRFCSDGMSHPGMFSKMFKFAVNNNNYSEVLSFADRRYSNGGMYSKAGFVHDGDTSIDYQYVIDGKRLSKQAFTKQKIAKKFGIAVDTERSAMRELGIPRIYDCGKMRFIWRAE